MTDEEKQDACPKCLDSMKVIIGDKQPSFIKIGSHIIHTLICPECGHTWQCGYSN